MLLLLYCKASAVILFFLLHLELVIKNKYSWGCWQTISLILIRIICWELMDLDYTWAEVFLFLSILFLLCLLFWALISLWTWGVLLEKIFGWLTKKKRLKKCKVKFMGFWIKWATELLEDNLESFLMRDLVALVVSFWCMLLKSEIQRQHNMEGGRDSIIWSHF